MKRSWTIALGYAACVAATVAALAWLSHQALSLDRAEQLARAEAALDENVAEALWRLDTMLTPLLAQEAARPYFVYRPYYVPPGSAATAGGVRRVASPLLVSPPELIKLHFQLQADGAVLSPQCPGAEDLAWVQELGVSPTALQAAETKRGELQGLLCFDDLAALLPAQTLPPVDVGELAWTSSPGAALMAADEAQAGSPSLVNEAVLSKVQRQLDEANLPAPQSEDPFQDPGVPQGVFPAPAGQRVAPAQTSAAVPQTDQQAKVRRDASAYNAKNRALQSFAQNAVIQQRLNYDPPAVAPALVSEGVSRPLWLGEQLLLARRVTLGSELLVQGCWLDWPALNIRLREEVADLLPELSLVPVTEDSTVALGRVLATLPVQLEVPAATLAAAGWTPLRISLAVAWAFLALAAVAFGVLLSGVIRLSERRAAFVSAVTHELRTPLTTFRMYAEMLADEMVADPAQRKSYLETLRVEAERLSHLVANVLSYARLERGKKGGRRERMELESLLDRILPRLKDRAAQAGFQIETEFGQEARAAVVSTDPAAVEQILFNLVDNACKYAALGDSRVLSLALGLEGRWAEIRVRDYGPGIAADVRRRLFQPFSKTVEAAASSAPGVGLGLALSRRLAGDLDGHLALESTPREGASFLLRLPLAPRELPPS